MAVMHYDMKLVVSDIDDTLLPKGGVIYQGTRRAVAECRRRGIVFSLASGRWFPSAVTVAETLGVSRQAVSKWERGEADPSTANLLALGRLYGVPAEELLRAVTGEKNPDTP